MADADTLLEILLPRIFSSVKLPTQSEDGAVLETAPSKAIKEKEGNY